MNLYLHFTLVNSDFDQALADELYDGQESEDNIKHEWEDEFKVPEPVKDFKIRNNAVYTLAGYFANDEAFSFDIPNTTICDVQTKAGRDIQFAVSSKLLKKTEKKVITEKDEIHLFFYLRDAQPLENPMEGIYILESDFPQELKK